MASDKGHAVLNQSSGGSDETFKKRDVEEGAVGAFTSALQMIMLLATTSSDFSNGPMFEA